MIMARPQWTGANKKSPDTEQRNWELSCVLEWWVGRKDWARSPLERMRGSITMITRHPEVNVKTPSLFQSSEGEGQGGDRCLA